MTNNLDVKLRTAHEQTDETALAELYAEASQQASDIDAACFYATHAYVYAFESSHPIASDLQSFLIKNGREE